MMIKLFICLILVLSCTMMGTLKSSSYKNRRIELENICEALKLIEMEITYKKDPLAKTFRNISLMKSCSFTKLLDNCSRMMADNMTLLESWEVSKDVIDIKCLLHKDDVVILDDFINSLGKSDSEGHKKLFEPISIRLQTNLKEAYKQEEKLGKMYISLGTAIGVVISIILI